MGDVKEVELKACPHCGHDQHCRAEVLTVDDDTLEPEDQKPTAWGVGCSCTAFVGPFSSEAEAITAWNTRPASTGKGEGWGPDREAVARIVDVPAWAFYDRHIGNPVMGAECRYETAQSLHRADQILALPVSPFKGGGNQGSLDVAAKPSEGGE